MSSYEFWDELGKIFNAVVAYQEKNLEFNKRFISPWIRLGNVFEKQDRNQEAMHAYERAVEIDGANPQNWYELGNIHFKMENYAEAVTAFRRAIELDPGFGWAHNNLALTLATMGQTEEAVAVYETAIALLQDVKDQAVGWNRLGNAYRKLNQYEQALAAFHRADELDRENSGFRDNMDEVAVGPTLVEQQAEVTPDVVAETASAIPTGPIPETAPRSEQTALAEQPQEHASELVPNEAAEATVPADAPLVLGEVPAALPVAESGATEDSTNAVDTQAKIAAADQAIPGVNAEVNDPAAAKETVTAVVQDSAQTFTETLPFADQPGEPPNADQPVGPDSDDLAAEGAEMADVVTAEQAVTTEPASSKPTGAAEAVAMASEEPQPDSATTVDAVALLDAGELLDPAPNSLADQLLEAEPQVLDVAQQVAYEAFLKDTSEPISGLGNEEEGDAPAELPGSPEPIAKIDESGELQIEMDTKNAHVWNELGNVYFNTSAFDDAIVAYSKAIELDRWFAWPYSNLALAYVQKRRFVEAILLYQRSIELFGTDKDKAISWNRLGNVYRRLNDYENAIAAYQRADALDPDNSTLSLQSRFSLLGNYAMEQKPSYVS